MSMQSALAGICNLCAVRLDHVAVFDLSVFSIPILTSIILVTHDPFDIHLANIK